jgi:hypothetical protein
MSNTTTHNGRGDSAAQFATRAQVAKVAIASCRRLRDSGKMYAPYGTNHIHTDLKKAGLNMPRIDLDWVKWRLWLHDLNLRSVWIKLRREGCMVAGFMHIARPKNKSPF